MRKLILLLPFFIISCTNTGTDKNVETSTVDTTNQINKEPKHLAYFDFDKFWTELGNAVQVYDTNKIKQFIHIPLEILGREDSDPKFSANENEVIDAFNFAINKGGYYDPDKDVSISNKQLLMSSLNSISEYNPSSDKQWINDFVFIKTKEGWKLETIYLNTKEYKKK